MGQTWYVQTPSGKAGPFTSSKLRQLAQTGKISPESLVSLDGKKWAAASRVKGLVFAAPSPAQHPPEPRPDDDYALVEDDLKKPAVDRPGGKTPSTYASANVTPLEEDFSDEELPRLSTTAGLPLRFGASFILGATAAGAASLLVKLAFSFRLVELKTTAASLLALVGLPAIAFVVVFALIFWLCGRDVEPPKITGEMSDDEIADALKRY
jgi:hypothetical protein